MKFNIGYEGGEIIADCSVL